MIIYEYRYILNPYEAILLIVLILIEKKRENYKTLTVFLNLLMSNKRNSRKSLLINNKI